MELAQNLSAPDLQQNLWPNVTEAQQGNPRSPAGNAALLEQQAFSTPAAQPTPDTSNPEQHGRGQQHANITPKDHAGQLVWAKSSKFPWWPARVLSEKDPLIPTDQPRRGAVPVRFFGTYEFAWIESQRAISTFDKAYDERTSKSKAKPFLQAMQEAHHFQTTGELPAGFTDPPFVTPAAAKPAAKKRKVTPSAKAKVLSLNDGSGGKGSRAAVVGNGFSPFSSGEAAYRKVRIMQHLALAPPGFSPYAHTMCINPDIRLISFTSSLAAEAVSPKPPASEEGWGRSNKT